MPPSVTSKKAGEKNSSSPVGTNKRAHASRVKSQFRASSTVHLRAALPTRGLSAGNLGGQPNASPFTTATHYAQRESAETAADPAREQGTCAAPTPTPAGTRRGDLGRVVSARCRGGEWGAEAAGQAAMARRRADDAGSGGRCGEGRGRGGERREGLERLGGRCCAAVLWRRVVYW